MKQDQLQSKADDNDGSMRIDNDTIFNILMKLNENVSGMSASIESLAKKIDKIQDQTDKMQDQTDNQIDQLHDQIDGVSDIAKDADNKVNQIHKRSISKLSLLELIWIPVLASIIPTVLRHIYIH